MKTKRSIILYLSLTMLLIGTSCAGPSLAAKDPDTHVVINKDGSIDQVIIESFDGNEYDLDELKAMIDDMVKEFNGDSKKVTVKKADLSNGATDVEITYDNASSYTDFNREVLYVGDVSEYLNGNKIHPFDDSFDINRLKSISGQTQIKDYDLKGCSLLAFSINDRIYVPGKILFATDDVKVSEDMRSAKKSENAPSEGYSFVIYK